MRCLRSRLLRRTPQWTSPRITHGPQPAAEEPAILAARITAARAARSHVLPFEPTVLYLIVFLGGGLGAALRHGVNVGAARLVGTSFPYGTMAINVTGSLAMGVLAGYFAFRTTAPVPQHWRLFLTTGLLGGYTTFSAFSLEAALLIERSQHVAAGVYALGSVILGIVALFVGMAAGRALF